MAKIPSYNPEAINRRIARIYELGITPSTAKSVSSYYSNVLENASGARAGYVKSYTKAKEDVEKVRKDFGDDRPFTKEEYMEELKELTSNPSIQTTVRESINYINDTARSNIGNISSEWFENNDIDEDDFRDMISKLSKREFVQFINEAAATGKMTDKEGYGSSGGFADVAYTWLEDKGYI